MHSCHGELVILLVLSLSHWSKVKRISCLTGYSWARFPSDLDFSFFVCQPVSEQSFKGLHSFTSVDQCQLNTRVSERKAVGTSSQTPGSEAGATAVGQQWPGSL